jgi:hypothetical protein
VGREVVPHIIMDAMFSSVDVCVGYVGVQVCTVIEWAIREGLFWSPSLLQHDSVTVSSLLHTAITFKKKKKNAFVA